MTNPSLRWLLAPVVLCSALTGCSATIEGGLEVALVFETQAPPDSFASERYDALRLDPSYLTTWSVELRPCTSDKHGVAAPTVVAAPAIERLDAPAEARVHGLFEPPPDDYCAARVVVRAADEDAAGVAAADMLGLTLAASGTADGVAWRAETSVAHEHDLAFAEPVTLRADERWTLTLRYDPVLWFSELELVAAEGSDPVDPDALGRALVVAALDSASVTLEPAP